MTWGHCDECDANMVPLYWGQKIEHYPGCRAYEDPNEKPKKSNPKKGGANERTIHNRNRTEA